MAECNARLAEKEEEFEDIKAEHAGARAILDLAHEKVQAASDVRDAAESSLQQASVEKKLAQSKAMDQDQTLATLLSEAALTDGRVQQLDIALSALAELEACTGDAESKENIENMANKENMMAVEEPSKGTPMAVDQGAVVTNA